MRFFDVHCHVEAPSSAPPPDQFRPEAAAGRLLCGVGPGDWAFVAGVAAAWPGSVAAYGLHPWQVEATAGDWLGELEQRLAADPAAWVGEVGLDAKRGDASPGGRQSAAFAAQLRLARLLGRKVNLHGVGAWDEVVATLDEEYLGGGAGTAFIAHSFGGPHQIIGPLAERGAYFSVGPLFSRRESRRDRARVALLPADRLLLESDAFLRPRLDAIEDLRHSLVWLAEARGVDATALGEQIADNTRRLFVGE